MRKQNITFERDENATVKYYQQYNFSANTPKLYSLRHGDVSNECNSNHASRGRLSERSIF